MNNPAVGQFALLKDDDDDPTTPDPWWTRWWVLGVYSYASGLQGLLWMTYSSVPDASKKFLNCGDGTLNTILIEGPIAYVIVVIFASWLFTTASGLRRSVLASCGLCAFAAALRCLPPLLFADQSSAAAILPAGSPVGPAPESRLAVDLLLVVCSHGNVNPLGSGLM